MVYSFQVNSARGLFLRARAVQIRDAPKVAELLLLDSATPGLVNYALVNGW